ncbi:MAG: Rieske (2Fe-2S) protein, partial [Streptosporangiaceae bacterium]
MTVNAAAMNAGVRRRPTVVAHSGQLPEAGSFITADAAGTPLLVVRQDDGSVRALANVCRHRGARVETELAGRRKMFACPYHRWCYSRTGAIRSIPFDDGFTGVAKADLGLVEHPSFQTGNLVLVVPD